MPSRSHAARVLRRDLDAARAAWLKEADHDATLQAERERSGFLAGRDDAGRVIDFHALRHTFITNLVRSGVHAKVAQSLARHSTVELTLGRYSHVLVEDQRAGVEALPTLRPGVAASANGTDGLPLLYSNGSKVRRSPPAFDSKTPASRCGAPASGQARSQ